jgi:hypothetical protein
LYVQLVIKLVLLVKLSQLIVQLVEKQIIKMVILVYKNVKLANTLILPDNVKSVI